MVEKYEDIEEVVVHFDGWSARYDELIHVNEGRLRQLSQEQLLKCVRTRKLKVSDTRIIERSLYFEVCVFD